MTKDTVKKQQLTGVVVSDKMDKSVVVRVNQYFKHALYRKYVRSSKRYNAHDDKNEYKNGDKVVIELQKPMSKTKKWAIVKKIS